MADTYEVELSTDAPPRQTYIVDAGEYERLVSLGLVVNAIADPAGPDLFDQELAEALTEPGSASRTAVEALAVGYTPAIATAPAGSVFAVVQNGDGSWPDRLSDRTDLRFLFLRIVPGSADPATVVPPSVTGAYDTDAILGV